MLASLGEPSLHVTSIAISHILYNVRVTLGLGLPRLHAFHIMLVTTTKCIAGINAPLG